MQNNERVLCLGCVIIWEKKLLAQIWRQGDKGGAEVLREWEGFRAGQGWSPRSSISQWFSTFLMLRLFN